MIDTDALRAQVSKTRTDAKAICQETEARLVESARLIDEFRRTWKAVEWPEDLPRLQAENPPPATLFR